MSEQPSNWRRVSRGLFWIGLGALLLLNTLDVVPWSFWIAAVAYWPVLLIALGTRLVFERSRMPALTLLSPLLVIGTLGWVAASGAPRARGPWVELEASRIEGTQRWRLTGGLAMARLDLEARPLTNGKLIEGRATSDREPRLRVVERSGETRVRFHAGGEGWVVILPTRHEEWDLAVAEDLPLALDLDMAFTDARLLLEPSPLERFTLDGAMNHLVLRLGPPRTDVRLYFEGAFNSIELVVPDATPVRVTTDGFLNVQRGRRETPPGGGAGYRVSLHGAFNRLRVRSGA